MKIFLAGATGAIGKHLIPLLAAAGHKVTGTTRRTDRVMSIYLAGATPVLMDALNPSDVLDAVKEAKPDVIIHELTSIPENFNMRRWDQEFAQTNRLRTEGTDNLLAAARAVGCPRFIAQSYTGWPYERTGSWVKTEQDPLLLSPEPAWHKTLQAIKHVESSVLNEQSMEGFVLRYGALYGPDTSIAPGGPVLEAVRQRQLPIVGNGNGFWSFLHIDDAASATLAAVESKAPGLYNIVDDEPARVSKWLPYLAETLNAKPPRHVPGWLARFAIGPHGVALMTAGRGASNEKAKALLPWMPRWRSWRDGFRNGLSNQKQYKDLRPVRATA